MEGCLCARDSCPPEEEGLSRPELSYTVQNELVTRCVSGETWDRLVMDARRYLLNISYHMDDYFQFHTFPPGIQTPSWTQGEKAIYVAKFNQWIEHGVDPTRHWGLFSLDFPTKTGNQCSWLSKRREISGALKRVEISGKENMAYLKEFEIRKFGEICAILLGRERLAVTNKASRECACEEILQEQTQCVRCLTHETDLQDKVVYCRYPGTGFVTGCTKCYAAVILQFLARLDELVDLVSLQLIEREDRFLKQFLELRYQLEIDRPPIPMDTVLERLNFGDDQQQDAHELLIRILTELHQSFEGEHLEAFNRLFVTSLTRKSFGSLTTDTIVNIDVHVDDCDSKPDLLQLLAKSLDSCEFMSSGTIFIVNVIRTNVVAAPSSRSPPQVKKAMCHIDFPQVLDMTAYGGYVYSLLGIVYHSGTSAEFGHYFAVFLRETRQFWLMVSNALLS